MDLIHNTKHYVSLPAAAYTKAGGAVEGAAIDTFGAERVLVQGFSGELGTEVNVYELELVECDEVGGAYTAVAAGDLIGTEPTFEYGVAGSPDEQNTVKTFEYVGQKRFLRANLKAPTGAGTGGGVIGANIVLYGLRHSVQTP